MPSAPLSFLALVSLLVSLGACASSRVAPTDPRLRLDPALRLDVESIRVDRTRGGTLDVQSIFTTRHNHELQAQYKLNWIDDSGQYSSTLLSRWNVIRISPGAPLRIDGTAPDPSVVDFQLQIRRNKAKGYE